MEDFVTTEYNFLLQELLQNQSESAVGVETPVALRNIPSSPPNIGANGGAGGSGGSGGLGGSGDSGAGGGFSYFN